MFAKKLLLSSAILSCALLAAGSAHAQATRTWVSGVGDDVNPCSRTAPCKTFAGAISKTAAKGQINVLDPGAYGAVTITKSITIDASNMFAGVLATLNSSGIIVNAATTDVVTLRGLTIDGAGTGANGIRFLQAKQLHVENCTIQNFVNRGIEVANTSNAVQLFVRDSVIKNNFSGGGSPVGNSGGILLKPTSTGSASAFLEGVSLDQNHFGLRVEANARATVNNSTASGNVASGIHAFSTGAGSLAASVILDNVVISTNATGVQAEGSAFASVRLSNTVITQNSVGLSSVSGGQLLSWGTNSVAGNGSGETMTGSVVPRI